jgi:hypothetical protein
MFGFIPPALRPMAAMGIPPGNVVIALALTAPAAVMAATGVPPGDREGVRVSNIVALLRESWV